MKLWHVYSLLQKKFSKKIEFFLLPTYNLFSDLMTSLSQVSRNLKDLPKSLSNTKKMEKMDKSKHAKSMCFSVFYGLPFLKTTTFRYWFMNGHSFEREL